MKCAKLLNYKQLPLVITNIGEPIYINDNQLTDYRRILQEGDVIGLNSVDKFFKVTYCHPTNLNISEEAKTQIFKKYFIGDLIGSGGFGSVHVCHMLTPENDESGCNVFKTYALKTVKITNDKAMREVEIMEALQNVEKLQKLRNEHILELIEHEINKDVLFMTLPLMTGGTLSQLIETNQRLSEDESRYYFHQLMKGLNYLHEKRYIHRDIKSDNLLLTQGKHKILKISDFGFAKFLEIKNNTFCGTKVRFYCIQMPLK